jgi:16S rRNA C967 or C1407 C5-methylase (RsmB/RsmF family)
LRFHSGQKFRQFSDATISLLPEHLNLDSMQPMLPDWMIEQIDKERREREERRPRLEINAPPPPARKEEELEREKRGVVTIQVWGD